MKQYDMYLALTPGDKPEAYIGLLTEKLMQSGLKYTRHVGAGDDIGARRDIRRLVDSSKCMVYISNEATNASETSVTAVKEADRDGMDIYVVRIDNSSYPSEVASILANAADTYDATDSTRRSDVFDGLLIRLGAPDPVLSGAPDPVQRRDNDAAETIEQAEEDEERPVTRPQSTWTIVIEIILGIIVIAGIIAMAVK